MNEVSQHVMWARVEYQPAVAIAAFSALSVMPELHGPGFSAADSVQVAAYLASLRDVVATFNPYTGGPAAQVAEYTSDGHPLRLWNVNAQQGVKLASDMADRGTRGLLLVGDAEFSGWATQPATRNDGVQCGPIDKWGENLALAIDELLVRIGHAEQGPNIPVSMQGAVNVVLPLAAIAVIVTGAALAIIGSVAAWRYLDPDFRRDAVLVKTAAEDYAQRLGILQQTGQMPPPSENEKNAVDAVQKMASDRKTTDWLWGAGIAGGLIVGTLISVKLANAS